MAIDQLPQAALVGLDPAEGAKRRIEPSSREDHSTDSPPVDSVPTGGLPVDGTPVDQEPIDWQQALGEHERWLRTVVCARLGEPQAIDEVMQEISLAAVRQSAPIRDRSKVAPWLYRLAVRQVLMYRRKTGRRRRTINTYAETVRPTEHDTRQIDPLGYLLAEERRRAIRQAIARLPVRDAELLMLKYTENWSYKEIAQHLGISESAVEARLHRARAKLRRELEAAEIVETD